MNPEKIIKLKKDSLYLSLSNSDIFGKFFYKSFLHSTIIMEIFSANKKNGISYEKLCSNTPKLLGSRSSIQNILNEGLDLKILKKIDNKEDKRIKNYYLSDDFSEMILEWVKSQKQIFNS